MKRKSVVIISFFFNQIRNLHRPTDVPDHGLLCDILWSDPDEVSKEFIIDHETNLKTLMGEA